ncbi:hypothetical protein VSR68_38655 [Paraburkholderia phymatum]|uniref:hypothetical protein n=1 Tax=Paraburkholderia phymatum TaxID=148447 RepID=UPI003180CD60
MKARGLFVSLIVCLSWTAIEVDAVTLRGDRSCGQWTEAHQSPDTSVGSIATEGWVIGYLSAVATERRKDFIVGTDNESIFLWVTNYCRANPLDYVDDASNRLAAELIRRKGL